jgi:phosphatidate cytidylyltransferase
VVLVPATLEYLSLASRAGPTLPRPAIAVAVGALAFALVAGERSVVLVLLSVIVVMFALGVGLVRTDQDAVRAVAVSAFPLLYLAVPGGVLARIRAEDGAHGLLLLIFTIIVSDTGQYYGGRALGRRPLAPAISPKKTIEGAVSGVVLATVFFTALGAVWAPHLPVGARVVVGLTLSVLGIVGDLFESLLKRSAGVKDASALIPGHGGVLDRIDSLLATAPFYYVLLRVTQP